MFAETEINLVNGVAALCLGFVLLALVAWIDRKYLQKYEEVQGAEEEKKSRAEKKLLDEAVTEERDRPVGAAATGVKAASSRTADDIVWKDDPPRSADPAPTAAAAKTHDPAKAEAARKDEPVPSTASTEQPEPAADDQPDVPPAARPPVEVKAETATAAEAAPATTAEPQPTRAEVSAPKAEAATPADAKTDAAEPADKKPADKKPADTKPADVQAADDDQGQAATIDLRGDDATADDGEPAPAVLEATSQGADGAPPVLPRGAEAALASILEVVPDPRNTIALTRDPTAEVRLTKVEREQAITSSGQPRETYEPPAPTDEEWETPKEPAASDRLAASPEPSPHR